MSDVIWSDEDRARLEESADRLTEDVIYEKRCLTMDDRIIFIGLVTRLKTMAAASTRAAMRFFIVDIPFFLVVCDADILNKKGGVGSLF